MTYELLAPAGDLATARIALRYGADAVYLGGPALQLRAKKVAFPLEDIRRAAGEAHRQNRKIYVTVNAFARDEELEALPAYALQLQDAGVDGVIIADPGVMWVFHQAAPEVPIHVSTQANCTNAAAARVYSSLGARRVVPARELTLAQLAEMRRQLPEDMEIEAFIHGAMCMAYSGRCMISAYLTGRSANRGGLRPPLPLELYLNGANPSRGIFPLGRNRRRYGAAEFARFELHALSGTAGAGGRFLLQNRGPHEERILRGHGGLRLSPPAGRYSRRPSLDMGQLTHELDCVSHRPYCSGFYFGEVKHIGGDRGEYLQGCRYIAQVLKIRPGSGGNSSKKQIFRRRRAGGRHPSGDYRPLPRPESHRFRWRSRAGCFRSGPCLSAGRSRGHCRRRSAAPAAGLTRRYHRAAPFPGRLVVASNAFISKIPQGNAGCFR